jgi:hypothetical protein
MLCIAPELGAFRRLIDGDEIERQMLTQRHGYLHSMCHQVSNDLSEALVAFVFRVMSHRRLLPSNSVS